MATERNLIRFDWAMKRLLRNKANYVVLEGFLSELFKFDITIIELPESESNRQTHDDKLNRIDIVAKTVQNEIILIELQVAEEIDYFHRMLYGVSKAITENIHIGETYVNVKKVYSVHIVYFELGKGKDYIYHGITEFRGIHKNDILILSDKQKNILNQNEIKEIFPEYYVLKVNTFNNLAKDTLDEWVYYLKNNEIPDSFNAKGLKEAKEVLKTDKMTKGEHIDYNNHLENMRYEKSIIESSIGIGFLQGEKIGFEKGRTEGEWISALKPLRNGKSIQEVAEFNDLSIEIVTKLSALLKKHGDQAEKHFDELASGL